MGLTVKDLISTIGAILVALIYYANAKGMDLAIISSTRGTIAALLIVGFAMCALGAKIPEGGMGSPMMILMSTLGGVALLLAVIGLITGNKSFVVILAALTLIMWVISTIRHIVIK